MPCDCKVACERSPGDPHRDTLFPVRENLPFHFCALMRLAGLISFSPKLAFSPCGADITSLCPKATQREVPALPSAPNLVCSKLSRPMERLMQMSTPGLACQCLAVTIGNGIKALLRFGFFII